MQDTTFKSLKSTKQLTFLPLSKLSLEISTNVTRPFLSILLQFKFLPHFLHLSSTGDLTSNNVFVSLFVNLFLFLDNIQVYIKAFENIRNDKVYLKNS